MLRIELPGVGDYTPTHLVSDFTGTLSVDGNLLPGVAEAMDEVAAVLTIHVVTADTMATARQALSGFPCLLRVLDGTNTAREKLRYLHALGPANVLAFGNGRNDRLLLKRAAVGVAVLEAEGCAIEAIEAVDVVVRTIHDAFALIMNPDRIRATLRG